MKNDQDSPTEGADDMQPEYDFSGGMRGKHFPAFQAGYKVVIHKTDGSTEEREYAPREGTVQLDPDVRVYFPDAATVNSTLRSLIRLIPRDRASSEI